MKTPFYTICALCLAAAAALPAQEEDDEAQEPEPGLGEIEDDIGEGDAEEATAEGAEA